ncbi:hypothetical protein [[Mycobacterium] crassicus]|uniref:ABM domain-containing protein n=1 Tax=[Mycobacterium] crassicus TaxID=2872309 RepID=A0ABU5XIK1_9MYCO|nr:hypothetical protein [Mycolicibacter sp. MYC098]MEB3022116.1 hypothetical protein [Mycolicibacter sp. MYC098]
MGTVMAALDFHGDTKTLKECYDKALRHIVDISPARPVIHLAVPRDYGLMVCDVWDSEDAMRAFEHNPEIAKAIAASGLPEPTRRVFEVHNLGWPISAMPLYR